MSKTLENLKSGNYEVVDNQGVSVTQHFIECLEKEFADLQSQLAEKDKEIEYQESMKILAVKNQNQKAIEQLEKVKEFCEANCDKCDDIETGVYCGKVIGLDNVLYMGDTSLYDFIDNQINELKGEEV